MGTGGGGGQVGQWSEFAPQKLLTEEYWVNSTEEKKTHQKLGRHIPGMNLLVLDYFFFDYLIS